MPEGKMFGRARFIFRAQPQLPAPLAKSAPFPLLNPPLLPSSVGFARDFVWGQLPLFRTLCRLADVRGSDFWHQVGDNEGSSPRRPIAGPAPRRTLD